jgi:DNA invertase Pin-like site-specific DNA recombinase
MTPVSCAVYTRKSSEEGLEQDFNSLDAQREACQAFILSQKAQGWKTIGSYDDGGFSGGTLNRPALQRLLGDIAARRIKVVVVYKVDRLTRSLADFAKLVEQFDAQGVSFVSVTQQFNTTSSMGRLTLNVLLSFAQFEREVTGERIRDKIAASKRKGMWMGGVAPMGYRPHQRSLVIDAPQAQRVREIHRLYLELGSVQKLKAELDRRQWTTPPRDGERGQRPFSRGHLHRILSNAIYAGQIVHKGRSFPGQHPRIIEDELFQRVQLRLAHQAQACSLRSNAAEPSLLSGLVFDSEGRRLQPTHSAKAGRRYRYYFRPARDGEAHSFRIPAAELEGAAIAALGEFLRDESRLLALMGDVDAASARDRIAAAAACADNLRTTATIEGKELIRHLVRRLLVGTESIEIEVRLQAAWGQPDGDSIVPITVPAKLKRCGLAMRLIVHGKGERAAGRPDPRLIALLIKAQRWFRELRSGESESIASIARAHGIESSDVTQTVYLAFLAPDIVQAIAVGEHPIDLGTRRLLASAPLPIDWREQRKVLGVRD